MKTQLLICDNDPNQANTVKRLVESFGLPLEVQIFKDPRGLLFTLEELSEPAILIMDIVLDHGVSGIETVRSLQKQYPYIPVIFISSWLEKACEVYEAEHCYFVYKRQQENYLLPALQKAMSLLSDTPDLLSLHEGKSLIRLDIRDILCIERIKRATLITTADKVYQVSDPIAELIESLPDSFVKCHRDCWVSFSHVKAMHAADFELSNGILVPISRRLAAGVREQFQNWLIEYGENIA